MYFKCITNEDISEDMKVSITSDACLYSCNMTTKWKVLHSSILPTDVASISAAGRECQHRYKSYTGNRMMS